MTRLTGFGPIAAPTARVLLLGSMPGERSLAAAEYYAHPQNAFWPIMAELCGIEPDADYASRCQALSQTGIALWDVLRHCRRAGSLDSAIERASQEANDFVTFFRVYPQIQVVACNGKTAERLYRQEVKNQGLPDLPVLSLPSTSPAYASLRVPAKLARWRESLAMHLRLR